MGRSNSLQELRKQFPDIIKVYRQPKHSRRALLKLHRKYNCRYSTEDVVRYYRSGRLPSDISETDARSWDKHLDWYLAAGGSRKDLHKLELSQEWIQKDRISEWSRERIEISEWIEERDEAINLVPCLSLA